MPDARPAAGMHTGETVSISRRVTDFPKNVAHRDGIYREKDVRQSRSSRTMILNSLLFPSELKNNLKLGQPSGAELEERTWRAIFLIARQTAMQTVLFGRFSDVAHESLHGVTERALYIPFHHGSRIDRLTFIASCDKSAKDQAIQTSGT